MEASRAGQGVPSPLERKENIVEDGMPETVETLRAREEEISREWQWLYDALNEVARARANREDATAFAMLQRQALAIGQRRVQLQIQLAECEKAAGVQRA
jgi:hypothetical protein